MVILLSVFLHGIGVLSVSVEESAIEFVLAFLILVEILIQVLTQYFIEFIICWFSLLFYLKQFVVVVVNIF